MERFRKIIIGLVSIMVIVGTIMPVHAVDGELDMSLMHDAIQRGIERENEELAASLKALNETSPDRYVPDKTEAAKASTLKKQVVIKDSELYRLLSLAENPIPESMTIRTDGVTGESILSADWILSSAPEISAEEKMTLIPAEKDRKNGRLTLRGDFAGPLGLFGSDDNTFDPIFHSPSQNAFSGVLVGYRHEFNHWVGLNAETGFRMMFPSSYGFSYMIPLTFGVTIFPYTENSRVSLPITASAGVFMIGDTVSPVLYGPSAGLRAAIAIDLADDVSLEFGTGFTVLMQFDNSEMSGLVLIEPLHLGLTIGLI